MAVGKRKREALPDEVEVDISAPEPPSKKELRRLKKGKPMNHKPANSDDEADPVAKAARKAASKNLAAHRQLDQAFQETGADPKPNGEVEEVDEADSDTDEASSIAKKSKDEAEAARKDAPGVWIGNLPWTVTKADLLKYITDHGRILPTDVTRFHMPGPTMSAAAASRHKKLTNRGFAYIDFKSDDARDAVIKLSESLVAGRAILIKNSKSYEGRPAQEAKKITDGNGKPPSARIFVGNLSFDATEDDLRDHFAKCGLVKSVFLATFPDSGNCKGYGWVTFDEVVSAEKAIRGWVELDPEDRPEEDEDEEMKDDKPDAKPDAEVDEEEDESKSASKARKERRKKKAKSRKWYVNRLKGRDLRMEFAEDATTRYVKRFDKKKEDAGPVSVTADITPPGDYKAEKDQSRQRRQSNDRPKKFDDSSEKPRAPRSQPRPAKVEESKDLAYLTGAVMKGTGKKVTF